MFVESKKEKKGKEKRQTKKLQKRDVRKLSNKENFEYSKNRAQGNLICRVSFFKAAPQLNLPGKRVSVPRHANLASSRQITLTRAK